MKGKDEHLRRLKKLGGAEIVRMVEHVCQVGGDLIRSEAQRSITTGSVSGANHVPSKPGDAPNNDTSVLRTNIKTGSPEISAGIVSLSVTSEAPYAAPLEFGTSKMAARPYLRPSRDKMEPKIQRLFAKELKGLIKRSRS